MQESELHIDMIKAMGEWAAAMDEHTKLWESETAKAVADAEAAGARLSDTDTARFHGDPATPFAKVPNLGQVRVVVH